MGNANLRPRCSGMPANDRGGIIVSEKNLLIISAGAFGSQIRDLAAGIQSQLGDECPWRLTGFLDDRDPSLGEIPVVASPEIYRPRADDLFVCAIGNPLQRAKYAELIRQRDGQLTVLLEASCKSGVKLT
jgi:hypothetical protein